MEISIKLGSLITEMRYLIGDIEYTDPEYIRALVELLATFLPGDHETAHDYAQTLLTDN